MRKALVTGAAGVIGSQLVPLLRKAGLEVLAADLKERPISFDKSVAYRQGDLNLMKQSEIDHFSPDVIFHLAATFERTTESLNFYPENFHHNVLLTHHLFDLVSKSPTATRLVFASSYLVYDPLLSITQSQSNPTKLHEGSRMSPRNLTGFAKASGEGEMFFLSSFSEVGVSPVAARIFRGYGLGSRDVISRWVRSFIQGEAIETYDLDSSFDFVYCQDSAQALLEIGLNSEFQGVLNIGSGNSRSMRDVLGHLKSRFAGKDIEIVELGNSPLVEKSQANIGLISRETGWSPRYDLEAGIDEIIAFEIASQ